QLAAVAGGQDPVTLNLDGLGRYRVVSALSRRGDELIVTGLSMPKSARRRRPSWRPSPAAKIR
ncbi:hypothetical protein OSI55_26765, partial [Mycobacterium ulcerans]